MSTNIHSGYRLKDGANMFDVVRKTRAIFLPALKANVASELLESTVFAYDELNFNEETRDNFVKGYDLVGKEINEWSIRYRMAKKISELMEEHPKLYQVSLGFAPDPVTGKMLVYFFGPGQIEDMFESNLPDEVEKYGYWNSTERPEDVSEEEWQERREAWDRVLEPTANLSVAMVMSKAVAPHEISPLSFSYEDIEALGVSMPTRKARVRKIAEILVLKTIDFATEEHPFVAMNRILRDEDLMNEKSQFVEERLGKDLTFADMVEWRNLREIV